MPVLAASLRLNQAAEAKRWIARAPVEHRGWEWRYLTARSDAGLAVFDSVRHRERLGTGDT